MEELTPNTRYEKFLSAAAGSGTAPDPVTREEKFLKAIADNAGGGGSLPDDPAQDGTYTLQNTVSSGTGTLSWAGGGSSGGVLVVHWNSDYTALDKTGQEILTAVQTGPVFLIEIGDLEDGGEVIVYMLQGVFKENGTYYFAFSNKNAANKLRCSSLSDYPEYYEP